MAACSSNSGYRITAPEHDTCNVSEICRNETRCKSIAWPSPRDPMLGQFCCLPRPLGLLLALWRNLEAQELRFHRLRRRFDPPALSCVGQQAVLPVLAACRTEVVHRDFSDLGTPEKMAALVRALNIRIEMESQFAGSVKAKVIETVKWSGSYYDENLATRGIEPSRITADNAAEIMRLCSRAFMVLVDEGNVSLARDFFQTSIAM